MALSDTQTSRKWIRRRIERIKVIDERTIERESTLILDLGQIPVEALPYRTKSHTLVLPVDRLERSTHMVTNIRVVGGNGTTVPTHNQERDVIVEGLKTKWMEVVPQSTLGMMEGLLRRQPDGLPLLARIFAVVYAMTHTEQHQLADGDQPVEQEALADGDETAGGDEPAERQSFLQTWRQLSRSDGDRIEECIDDAQRNPLNGRKLSKTQVGQLLGDLRRWQKSYLLLLELPAECLRDHRVTVTFRKSETIPGLTIFGRRPIRSAIALFRKLVGGTLSSALQFSVRRAVGTAESTHILVTAPDGFRAVDGRLRVVYRPSADLEPVIVNYRDNHRLPSVAHVHVDTEGVPVESASFIVSFYAYKTGFFVESLIASWVLWGIVQVFYDRVSHVGFDYGKAGLSAPLSAAIILLLPAAVVTLITQRDSHRVASKCFAIPRFLLASDAIATTGAASMLALGASHNVSRWGWFAALLTTQVVAARLTLGALVHEYRVSRGRSWIYRNYWALFDLQARRDLNEERFASKPLAQGKAA